MFYCKASLFMAVIMILHISFPYLLRKVAMYHLPKCVWLFTRLGAPNLFVPGDAYLWAQASVCYLIL